MDRTTKVTAVGELTEIFSASGSVVLARYSGLTVAEMTKLRGELRAKGGRLKVVRNRLAKIALKGQKGEEASNMFEGPIAIAYSEDFTAAPKVVVEFAKSNPKFEIVGGFMEENIFSDAKSVEALSRCRRAKNSSAPSQPVSSARPARSSRGLTRRGPPWPARLRRSASRQAADVVSAHSNPNNPDQREGILSWLMWPNLLTNSWA